MSTLLCEYRDGIAVVTLNRGTANALNTEMIKELSDLFLELRADAIVKGAIITGKDNFFSAGLDILEIIDYNEDQSRVFWKAFAHMMTTLVEWPKPLISAINGHSPAGGCIIAITADFRYMAEGNFKIGLNEVAVGIVVPMPVYKLFAMWVGARNAYQALIQGKMVSPAEALQYGLVDGLFPQDQVLAQAEAAMRQLIKLEPGTYTRTKLNLRADIIQALKNDFDGSFGDTIRHWWDPAARARLNGLVATLRSKSQA